MRSFDKPRLRAALEEYPKMVDKSFDIEGWLDNENNIALEIDGSYGLFDFYYPGVYTGHYFFKRRNRDAFAIAEKMISEIFDKYDAKAIRGITPVYNKPALAISLRLGFEDHGIIDSPQAGPCRLFILLRK